MRYSSSCLLPAKRGPGVVSTALVVSETLFAGEPSITHLVDASDEVECEHLVPGGREDPGA